jgi:hypothetical protein
MSDYVSVDVVAATLLLVNQPLACYSSINRSLMLLVYTAGILVCIVLRSVYSHSLHVLHSCTTYKTAV